MTSKARAQRRKQEQRKATRERRREIMADQVVLAPETVEQQMARARAEFPPETLVQRKTMSDGTLRGVVVGYFERPSGVFLHVANGLMYYLWRPEWVTKTQGGVK